MTQRSTFQTTLTATVAGTIGLVAWNVTMASAPRYSYGPDQDMGNGIFFPVLLGAAVIGGLVAPTRAWMVGLLLGLPGLVLSPWTAPRGDNDGLWLLVVPTLAIFTVVLAATATGASWLRQRLTA